MDMRGPYRNGALFLALSGLLHFAVPVFDGVTAFGLTMLGAGIAYLAMAWGMLRGWRWLAYVSFFVAGIGVSVALAQVFAVSPVPSALWWAIAALDAAAVLALFLALWRPAT